MPTRKQMGLSQNLESKMFKLNMYRQRPRQKGEMNYIRLGAEKFKAKPVTPLLGARLIMTQEGCSLGF